VFQNRYKSIVCEEEKYLLALVRYIGLNPLRAGLVQTLAELERYPWSSHAVLMGQGPLEGQAVDEVLARFGRRRKEAVRAYRAFVEAGVALGEQPDLVGGGLQRSLSTQGGAERVGGRLHRQAYDDRVLGSGEFVESLWREGVLEARAPPMVSLAEVTERVARAYGVEAAEIRRRRRLPQLSEARAVLCLLAVRHLGYKGVEVGQHLGLSRAGASAAVQRGQAVARRRPELLRLLDPGR
jgi:hypothetical protein